jgi:heme-degrading monooxygenase HmoA
MLRESDMFARAVVIKVKPGCDVELTRTFEQEVIPRFRKEKGFRGLLAFTVPNGTEALSFSLWDQKENSRGFITGSFAAVTALARVALGKPSVQVCEVGNSALPILGQVTDLGEGLEAMADLRVYQSALQPFKVAPARATTGRGFPLVWCLINSFHL